MKGRYLETFFVFAIALLLSSPSLYPQNAAELIKTAAQAKRSRHVAQQARKVNSAGNYVVQAGDNLYEIARAFKTTPKALMSANGLRSSKIRPGQQITIPGLSKAATKTQVAGAQQPSLPWANDPDYPRMSRLREGNQATEESNQPLRFQLIKAGFEMLGVRYRYNGMSETSGFDCSGLVKSLFSKFGIELPRSSRDQYTHGQKVEREELEVGDLVFSGGKSPNHVGIYIGEDKFIHAARTARKVIISDLNKIWYSMRYLGARRITELWSDEAESSAQLAD